MSTAIKEQKSRQEALADAERKIQLATRDTVESIRIIGQELTRIEQEELYEVLGRNDFVEYVEEHLKLDYRMARAWMRASQVLTVLDKEKVQLPYNQSQVLELSKLRTTEAQVGVWQKVLDFCDKEGTEPTVDIVRSAVEKQRKITNEYKTRARFKKKKEPLDIDLGDVNGSEPAGITLSENGEKALNRIRRLCGDDIADAVRAGNPKVSEGDIITWSEQEGENVKTLAYWIVFRRWSLRKALAYDESIDAQTKVEKLMDIARSHGGRVTIQFEDAKITVEIA